MNYSFADEIRNNLEVSLSNEDSLFSKESLEILADGLELSPGLIEIGTNRYRKNMLSNDVVFLLSKLNSSRTEEIDIGGINISKMTVSLESRSSSKDNTYSIQMEAHGYSEDRKNYDMYLINYSSKTDTVCRICYYDSEAVSIANNNYLQEESENMDSETRMRKLGISPDATAIISINTAKDISSFLNGILKDDINYCARLIENEQKHKVKSLKNT